MSETAAPQLLSHDKEMLDRVANPLREGRGGFSVLVCPPELWAVATGYIREKSGKEIPEPRLVRSGDEMVRLLAGIQEKPPTEVESFAVDDANVEVLTALNWNREKVRRGGHVLAWLGSADELQTFIQYAPDAYSFRDYTLVLRGEGSPDEGWAGEEPPDVKTARLLFELPRSPEERAAAAAELSQALRRRGRIDEARRVAVKGLGLISRDAFSEGQHTRTRVALLESLVNCEMRTRRQIDLFRWCRAGVDECGSNEAAAANRLGFELHALDAPPLAVRRAALDGALRTIALQNVAAARLTMLDCAAGNAFRRGSFPVAARYYGTILREPGIKLDLRATAMENRSRQSRLTGRLDRAETDLAAANEVYLRAGFSELPTVSYRVALLLDRAEISAAEKLATSCPRTSLLEPGVEGTLAWFRTRGDVAAVLAASGEQIRAALGVQADGKVQSECGCLRSFLSGPRPTRLKDQELPRALEIMDAAGEALIAYAAGDPPWYEVIFPAHRAGILALFNSRHEEAIAAASESITLARRLWKDALPFSTRTLVQCLARAGRWSAMVPAVQMALNAAREADQLRELATVQAYEIARLGRAAAPRASVEAALSAIKHTFSEMDAPRVEAETWLEVAPFLPPTATFPDAMEIADHAHGLFLDMPMPEMAARCMEWLGDIYTARGERGQAERCYRMCLGTLDRYELFPRKALVQEKLAGVLSPS